MSETLILPCPWRGGKCKTTPLNFGEYMVECVGIGQCNAMGPNKPTESETVEAWNEVAGMRQAHDNLAQQLSTTNDLLEVAVDALEKIERWTKAYPLEVFPEPDFKRVRELLAAGGITIDAVSASNMRHVINGVSGIVETAMKRLTDGDGEP